MSAQPLSIPSSSSFDSPNYHLVFLLLIPMIAGTLDYVLLTLITSVT